MTEEPSKADAGREERVPGETRTDLFRRRLEDHRVGSVLVITTAALVAIGGAIGGIQQIAGLFDGGDSPSAESSSTSSTSSSPPPAASVNSSPTPDGSTEVVHLRPSELGTAVNSRFGFTLEYPLTWERNDPVNGDGLTANGPEDGLSVVAYGSLTNPDLNTAAQYVEDSGGRLVDGPGQQNVRAYLQDGTISEVYGERVELEVPAQGDLPATSSVVLKTWPEGRDITMVCTMPSAKVESWRGACLQLISTLTITYDWAH